MASVKREQRSVMPESYGSLFTGPEVQDLVAYLAHLDGRTAQSRTAATTKSAIPPETDPASWVTYGKNSAGWRYSPLAQISTANVSRLAPAWVLQSGDRR